MMNKGSITLIWFRLHTFFLSFCIYDKLVVHTYILLNS